MKELHKRQYSRGQPGKRIAAIITDCSFKKARWVILGSGSMEDIFKGFERVAQDSLFPRVI